MMGSSSAYKTHLMLANKLLCVFSRCICESKQRLREECIWHHRPSTHINTHTQIHMLNESTLPLSRHSSGSPLKRSSCCCISDGRNKVKKAVTCHFRSSPAQQGDPPTWRAGKTRHVGAKRSCKRVGSKALKRGNDEKRTSLWTRRCWFHRGVSSMKLYQWDGDNNSCLQGLQNLE